MATPHNELGKEEKIAFLEGLIDNENGLSDNQPIYQAYLSDPDPEVRLLAIKGLWDYPDPALIDIFIDTAGQDPDPQVRNRAILALGRYVYEGEMADYDYDWGPLEGVMRQDEMPKADYQRVVTFLLGIARNPAAPLDAQCGAVEALGFSSDPEIADLVEQAYYSPHVDLKVSALFAMGRSGLVRWEPFVLAELNNPEPRLQMEAVRAAAELFLDEAAPVLLRLARSAADLDLRHAAIWALGHTTSLEAWELLDNIANSPLEEEETRQIAEEALDEYYMFQEMDEAESDFYEDDELFEEDEDNGGGNGRFL